MTFDDMTSNHYFAPIDPDFGYREETVQYKDNTKSVLSFDSKDSENNMTSSNNSNINNNDNNDNEVNPETEDFLDILLKSIKNEPIPFDYSLENWFGSSSEITTNTTTTTNTEPTDNTTFTDFNSNNLNALLSELDMHISLDDNSRPPSSNVSNTSNQFLQTSPKETQLTPVTKNFTNSSSSSSSNASLKTETGLFICHYCDSTFRKRGYLTRHIKKHAIEKAYRCPFYRRDIAPRLRCHTSGGFSRRDTYKTHLRARHLLYPEGVRPQERSKSSGHCAQCGEFFSNVENWVESHVESGECSGLPSGYVRQMKSERKPGKLKAVRTSNGKARFISTVESVVEPEVLQNKDALEVMAIVAKETKRGNVLAKSDDDRFLMSWV